MGWSFDRYLTSTLTEFTLASTGYWRRWERNVAWLARELIHTMISLSPDIKSSKKPSKKEIMKLSIDDKNSKEVEVDVLKAAKEYEDKLKHGLYSKDTFLALSIGKIGIPSMKKGKTYKK